MSVSKANRALLTNRTVEIIGELLGKYPTYGVCSIWVLRYRCLGERNLSGMRNRGRQRTGSIIVQVTITIIAATSILRTVYEPLDTSTLPYLIQHHCTMN